MPNHPAKKTGVALSALTALVLFALEPATIHAAATAATGPKPNVVLIITDQQFVTMMSAAGNPYLRTPAMDSLAARGVRFEKSYCTYPVCTPSRASHVTSRMPHEFGILSNQTCPGIPDDAVNLGAVFRQAGYRTAWAGKWHVPAPYPGFMSGERAKMPGFDVLPLQGPGHRSQADKAPGMGSDPTTTKAAVNFLSQPQDRPFLLVVSLLNPHDICEYPKEPDHFPKPPVADAELPPLPINYAAMAHEPSLLAANRARTMKPGSDIAGWGEREWRQYRWTYNRLTEVVDGLVGQVLAALEKTPGADNTLIVFTSDHGEMGGSHRLKTKTYMYEEAVAVPMIVCPPRRAAGSFTVGVDRTNLVSGLDLFPTMCDFAGLPIPGSLEGLSLRPLIENQSGNAAPHWRDYVVSEINDSAQVRMVRTERYKYIAYAEGENREQFFDLDADPGEMKNLIADRSTTAEVTRHRGLLQEWIRDTKDTFGQTPPAENGPKKRAGGKGAKKAK